MITARSVNSNPKRKRVEDGPLANASGYDAQVERQARGFPGASRGRSPLVRRLETALPRAHTDPVVTWSCD